MFIALAATLMGTLVSISIVDWLRWFVGSSLLVFGGFKLISFESFSQVFPQYDPLAARYRWYNYVFPLLEVFLGMAYILDLAEGIRYGITFALFGFSLLGMWTNLNRRGPSRQNTWLGKLFRLPMSTALLFEDLVVTVFSLILVIVSIFR